MKRRLQQLHVYKPWYDCVQSVTDVTVLNL